MSLQVTTLSDSTSLNDLFVFPHLIERDYLGGGNQLREYAVSSVDDLLARPLSVIHGPNKSGKSALAKHLVLSLVNAHQPVLFVDLHNAKGRLNKSFLRRRYEEQFHGDYSLWYRLENKTLVVDAMTAAPGLLDFITSCSDAFERIYLFASSDVFDTYLADDRRLANFRRIRLEPFTRSQQEELIRNRLTTLNLREPLTDGLVDQVENRVDSVIISNRVVPRYPFFVLSILQTFDKAMPPALDVTSYGHCYHVFILASLHRADIPRTDDAVNSAFNFAQQLALAKYRAERTDKKETFDFASFKSQYKERYVVEASLINRLTNAEHGILDNRGEFKSAYMYYYFLGKVLARNASLAAAYLPEICDDSHEEGNYLILMFAIHHASEYRIIDDILLRMMVEMENTPVATLSREETSRFRELIGQLPETIEPKGDVKQERAEQRRMQDEVEKDAAEAQERQRDMHHHDLQLKALRVLKNNRVLGQVLRTQYGSLPKAHLEEIVETIADSSLRVVNLILKDEEEIQRYADYVRARRPTDEVKAVRSLVAFLSLLWTVGNIEQAVYAVNVPSIAEIVEAVVERNQSPAYEMLGFFYQLDSGEQLTWKTRDKLAELYKRHDDDVVRRMISLRTQVYMNTHRSKASIAQSVCSILGITYKPLMNVRRIGTG